MENYLLKTKRLGFRLLKKSDISYLEGLESDFQVKRFFPRGAINRNEIEAMIVKFMDYYHQNRLPTFIVFDLESGCFIGRIGFGIAKDGSVEVGYVLHQKFWGKGYASEMLEAALNYAKEYIEAEYIIAYADASHIASQRVMEKCKMKFYKKAIDLGDECLFYRIENRLF
jgi:RimJ/RimL family protein N-acetyltransferase